VLAAGHPILTELTPLRERPGMLERLELGDVPLSAEIA
jgi:hypothetical protein